MAESNINGVFDAAKMIRPFVATGSQFVATGQTLIFAIFVSCAGVEGFVQGFNFYWEAEDYYSSPISIVEVGTSQWNSGASTNPNPLTGNPVAQSGSPYFVPPTRDRKTPFMLPFGGFYFDQNKSIGLQVKNVDPTGQTFYAEGMLVGICWNVEDREKVLPGLGRFIGRAF